MGCDNYLAGVKHLSTVFPIDQNEACDIVTACGGVIGEYEVVFSLTSPTSGQCNPPLR